MDIFNAEPNLLNTPRQHDAEQSNNRLYQVDHGLVLYFRAF